MSSRAAARVAWAIWAVALLVWAISFWLRTLGGVSGTVERVLSTLAFVGLCTAGMLVASRRPDAPFGWIVSAYGLIVACEGVAIGYALARASPGVPPLFGDGTAVAWLGTWIAPVANALLTLALLLVPDGRLPSPGWRFVAAFVVASGILGAVSGALATGALANGQPNPLAMAGAQELLPQLRGLSRTFLLIGFAAAVVSLLVRFRGAAGEERQQLKWVATGALVWVLATLAVRINPSFLTPFLGYVYLIGLGAFVATVTVAILRYRLYDIDLVISRTLVYGALGLCITITYVGVVAGIGSLAGTSGEPGSDLVLSLVATALVAVIFQPARERLQRLANRLVYGQRASPYDVLADFSGRIAGALSVDEVLPRMAEAAAHGVRATRSRVRVYVPGGLDQAVAWPPGSVASSFERTAPVLLQGVPVGEIAISKPAGEELSRAERGLLDDLATQAGPAFGNVRLTEELRASRQRIVAAQDAERRRIERDLHDGAQQHLVALSINLRLAQELIEADPRAAYELLTEVQGQAADALSTLRDLARGIYPPALADRGIAAALEAHLAKSHLSSALDVQPADAHSRFAPEVEAAVYFCVLEALQNCAKHAPGAAMSVRLQLAPDHVSFVVADDGQGFDPAQVRTGSGMRGMHDRLAAVGGNLAVQSAPGDGTTIVGSLPATGFMSPRLATAPRA